MTIAESPIFHDTIDGPGDHIRPDHTASPLAVSMHRPNPTTVVVAATGQVDENTVARLDEMLASRLRTALRTVVLDLTDVDFLSVAGLHALNQARMQAVEHGITLRLLVAHHEVLRALEIAGLDGMRSGTLADALRTVA